MRKKNLRPEGVMSVEKRIIRANEPTWEPLVYHIHIEEDDMVMTESQAAFIYEKLGELLNKEGGVT